MRTWIKRLWPVDGQGARSWRYCQATPAFGLPCVAREIDHWTHADANGRRWAA